MDTTISFNGSGGNLDMSSGGWAVTGVPDPILTVSMTGTGVNTATANGGGGYNIASFFNVFADVSIPNSYGPTGSSFSITQPTSRNGNPIIATDPGLTVTAPPSTAAGNSFSAFDGLFPPLSGSEYTGSVTNTAPHFFQYNSTDFYLTFKGPVSLTLGDTPTVVQSGDSYSYYYPDSELELTANIVFNDPVVDFTGTVEITTTVAAPDSSPGWPAFWRCWPSAPAAHGRKRGKHKGRRKSGASSFVRGGFAGAHLDTATINEANPSP